MYHVDAPPAAHWDYRYLSLNSENLGLNIRTVEHWCTEAHFKRESEMAETLTKPSRRIRNMVAKELRLIVKDKVALADFERSISVLEEFANDEVELKRIVPAHAESITKEDIKYKHDYYKTMLEGLRTAKQNGRTIEQVKDDFSVQEKFPFYNKKGQDTQDVQDKHNHNIEILWNLLDN